MEYRKLGVIETRFAELIWSHAPITSGELVKLCFQELEWKKSTTYTVLKKLCEQGLFQNEGGVVTPIVSREEFYSVESEKFVEETFQGSLPAFLAAFTARKTLTDQEIAEILSLDLGTVKSRINRGRKQLRKFLLESGNFSAAPPSKEAEKEG